MTGRLMLPADLCSMNARALASIVTAKANVIAAVTNWLASFMGVTGLILERSGKENPPGTQKVPRPFAPLMKETKGLLSRAA